MNTRSLALRSLASILGLAAMAALEACAVPVSGSSTEQSGEVAQAMYNDGHGRANACSSSQIEGGYEDVDGACLLTCWNCPGDIGGGSGSVPGGCTTGTCGDPGGGGGGGGTGGGSSTSTHTCDAAYGRCFDACPPTPVYPEGDVNPAHAAAVRRAELCYARCEAAHDRCS